MNGFSPRILPACLLGLSCAACGPPGSQEAPELHLEPETPTASDDLNVVFEFGEQSHRWDYRWYRNDDFVEEIDARTVPFSQTAKDEIWKVVVTAKDSATFITATAEVTVVNSPPLLSVSISNDAPPTTEEVVATGTYDDPDGDPVELAYTWRRVSDGDLAAHHTLTSDKTEAGDKWQVTVTGSDGTEAGDPVTADLTVVNSIPEIQSVDITAEPLFEDSVIEITIVARDADAHDLTHSIEWLVDDTVVLSHSTTLTGDHFSKNQKVMAQVVTSDGIDSTEKVTTAARTISNTPPVLESSGFTPDTVYEDSILHCNDNHGPPEDLDGDQTLVSYRWEVDGQDPGYSLVTLDGSSFDKGQVVECFVTPWDDEEAGAEILFSYGVVQNTPPVLESVTLDPTRPNTEETLSAVPGSITDPDPNETFTYEYEWKINGVVVLNNATEHLSSANYQKDDVITLEATPSDGSDTGTPASGFTTIRNSAPVMQQITFNPATPRTEDTLVASAQADDADGDYVVYLYDWYVNGTIVLAGSNNLLDSANFQKGDLVEVDIIPHDLEDFGTSTSLATTVANTPPEPPSLLTELIPDTSADLSIPGGNSDQVQCTVDTASRDADGDPVTYFFEWTRDGVSYAGETTETATSSTTSGANLLPQEVWICLATPSDEVEAGDRGSSQLIVPVPCASVQFTENEYVWTSNVVDIETDATLEVWFNPITLSSFSNGQNLVLSSGWSIRFCDGNYAITALGSSFGGSCTSSNYLSVDQWHHLAIRVDASSNVSAFLNGTALTRHAGTGTFNLNYPSPLTFGLGGSNGDAFTGYIGEVRAWDRALSDVEIFYGMDTWLDPQSAVDLVGWWPFIEGSLDPLDHSYSGNHAVLTNDDMWSELCPY
jgi:hypothetical protein